MPKLLYVEASPRGGRSISTQLAHGFIQPLVAAGWTLDHLPLWDIDLPAFDGHALEAKYANLKGAALTAREAEAWSSVGSFVRQLAAADRIIISTPMWNLGIPYRLKHWFDLVTQPGLSFRFDPATGYVPLLAARPVTVVLTSAGDFSDGPSWGRHDFASPYLEAALGFIGLTDVEIVLAGPTMGDPAISDAAGARAAARLAALSASA